MRNKRLLLSAIAVLTLLMTSCAVSTPNQSAASQIDSSADDSDANLRPITLGVGFIPSVQFAPMYVGIEKGFFADAGLDIELDYGYENDYLKLVGTGETQFMIGSGDQVVLGRAQGLPVRYVMKWYTKYPVVIASLKGSGILQPADLADTTVGIPGPFGASYVAFRGILEAANLDEGDLKMESIGFTQAAALSEGAVDTAVVYAANEPVVLGAEDIETDIIALDDYLQIPANGLVTNEQVLQEEPELVAAMVRATLQAIRYTLENPDEAFEIAIQYVPEAGGENREINRAVFDASLDYWTPESGVPTGESTAEEWAAVAELMQRIDLVDTLVDPETLYTNEFLPAGAAD